MLRQPCPALRSTSSPPKYAILDEAGFDLNYSARAWSCLRAVVLNAATAEGTSGNSFYGLAIGMTVMTVHSLSATFPVERCAILRIIDRLIFLREHRFDARSFKNFPTPTVRFDFNHRHRARPAVSNCLDFKHRLDRV